MMCHRFGREHRSGRLWLLLMLWLLSGWHVVWAEGNDFRVTDYMMSGNYRYPDKVPFVVDHWWKGLSISTFWYPKMMNFQYDYSGIETSGFGLALTKDFSKSHAGRLSFAYNHDRLEGMIDYQWNLSNYWLGYNPARRFEWLATVGLTGGAAKYEGKFRRFYGGQVGLQLRHTLSPWVSLYVEPQYKAMSPLYDGYWELGNIVDDGLAVQVGVLTRLTGPLREGGYGTAVAYGAQVFGHWIADLSGKVFLGHGMKVNRHYGLHRWYVELLGGTQLRDGEHEIGKLKLYQGDFEMNVGMRLNNLLALQLGAFGERLDLTQQSNYPEQVYGYRAELTFDLLRFVWHKAEENGWAWTIGGGMEGGRVELWNHVPGLNLERFIEPTVHTQLRRRLFGQTWLVLQGRMQQIDVDHDHLQVMAFAGVHQNLVGRKYNHRPSFGWKGLWLAGSWGAWDMRNSLVRGSLGYDINDTHGVRLDYSYSRLDSHHWFYIKKTNLNLFGLDYLMNVRNAFLGYDPQRRLNVYLFAGYNMAVHQEMGAESFWHAHTYVGMEGGAQLELKISKHLSVFAEEKTLFLSSDPFITNDFTQGFGMTGLVGVKVRL
ncbi:MAG: outer membrane beta-barrel protein [Bacteroidales bacterium]|nr:outer membrane beta-barrel protein [Bacteroidales bacterium]